MDLHDGIMPHMLMGAVLKIKQISMAKVSADLLKEVCLWCFKKEDGRYSPAVAVNEVKDILFCLSENIFGNPVDHLV